jgi:hypothetical protein
MKIKKLADLKVGSQVRTSPPAKRLGLGDIEMPTPDLVWKITKNDGEEIVLFNERESAGPLTLPKDHVRIHAFHDDPDGTDGILALNCQIRIKLGQVDCSLIRG